MSTSSTARSGRVSSAAATASSAGARLTDQLELVTRVDAVRDREQEQGVVVRDQYT